MIDDDDPYAPRPLEAASERILDFAAAQGVKKRKAAEKAAAGRLTAKAAKAGPPPNAELAGHPPFVPLGYERKRYFFFAESSQQVISYGPRVVRPDVETACCAVQAAKGR